MKITANITAVEFLGYTKMGNARWLMVATVYNLLRESAVYNVIFRTVAGSVEAITARNAYDSGQTVKLTLENNKKKQLVLKGIEYV